ncbi:hypothetical protein EDD85DRAFT_917403 [Armillaria nabsnona]|nr:hypothetical protein EDD85DRAFT_917403 [Armillaria nabsnona]
MQEHSNRITFKWVKGHAGTEGNEEADALALQGAIKRTREGEDADLTIDQTFEVTGARLSKITQAIAYEARDMTNINLGRIKASIGEARGFLWKSIHGTFKLGDFWEKLSPEYMNQVYCPECKILIECHIPGQDIIWRLMEELWKKKHNQWYPLSFELALGSLLVTITDDEGKRNHGTSRLYRILMSEAHKEDKIWNTWLHIINQRLMLDRIATKPRKFGLKAAGRRIVLRTWSRVLKKESSLPENWIDQKGILVGMEPIQKRP